jgi:RES domain-containing protein
VGFILLARGRWNRHDEYGCLYTSLSREGAFAEYVKELRRLGIESNADQPKDLVTLNVGVARVLDLTDTRERARFGVSLDTLTGDGEDDLESCRLVADLARLANYDAILSPSASLAGEHNLNLYIDGRADHLRLMEGSERAPLNY